MIKCRIFTLLVIAFMLVISLATRAAAQATLVIPEAIDIVGVDNRKYSTPLFSGGDTTLKLEPGQHRIVVEYDVIFDTDYDDHERIKSMPFRVSFSVEPGKHYYIKLPAIKNVKQAKKFASKPVIELVNRSTNRAIATELGYQAFDGSFSKQYNQPDVSQNLKPAAVITAPRVAVTTTSSDSKRQDEMGTANEMPLKMLEYWWGLATEQQRKQFIQTR